MRILSRVFWSKESNDQQFKCKSERSIGFSDSEKIWHSSIKYLKFRFIIPQIPKSKPYSDLIHQSDGVSENGEIDCGSAGIAGTEHDAETPKAEDEAAGTLDPCLSPLLDLRFGVHCPFVQCASLREHDPRV